LLSSGIKRFIIGLFKKIIIANSFATIADSIMDLPPDSISASTAWLGVISYSIQIFFDFSGYSDMAIGLGRMFGFKILENFNYPYISLSIQEFWRRWHISLSNWFRDYVYIPLGGNRKSTAKTYRNLIIVFSLTGIWHGATWSFFIWGMIHGCFILLERIGFSKTLSQIPKLFSWAYTILVVVIAWVFFRIEEINVANEYIYRLFTPNQLVKNSFIDFLNLEVLFNLLMAITFGTPILEYFKNKFFNLGFENNLILIRIKEIGLIVLFIYSILYINSGSYNPFIYFRF
jgi:alginate O-acetyltransferase complex protein AlgI